MGTVWGGEQWGGVLVGGCISAHLARPLRLGKIRQLILMGDH